MRAPQREGSASGWSHAKCGCHSMAGPLLECSLGFAPGVPIRVGEFTSCDVAQPKHLLTSPRIFQSGKWPKIGRKHTTRPPTISLYPQVSRGRLPFPPVVTSQALLPSDESTQLSTSSSSTCSARPPRSSPPISLQQTGSSKS